MSNPVRENIACKFCETEFIISYDEDSGSPCTCPFCAEELECDIEDEDYIDGGDENDD